MINVNRRDFLKGSVALGVAGALSGTVLNTLRPSTAYAEESTSAWTPTMCAGCTTWCAVEIKTQTDTGVTRAVDVRGNRFSKRGDAVNGDNAITCPKARMVLQETYDADRLKVPMIRTNTTKGRGVDPGFIPVSWDAAMDVVASHMVPMRNAGNAHKYTYFRGRYSYSRVTNYYMLSKIYGTPNSVSHSATCAEAENSAREQIVGKWGYDDYDIDNCRYLLLWGVDPVSSNRMCSGTIKKLGDRMAADDITVVSVDPRLNVTGAKAHKWLPVKPGTDGALASAMAHVILTEGIYNEDFVGTGTAAFVANTTYAGTFTELGTLGLVEWWNQEVKDMTPAAAAAITGISAEDIIEVAKGFAASTLTQSTADNNERAKAISWCGPGVGMQPNGVYHGWAVLALTALVGGFDHIGGEIIKSGSASTYDSGSSSPSYSSYQDSIATTGAGQQKMIKYVSSGTALEMPAIQSGSMGKISPTNRAADSIADASPYEIKAVIGIMANFTFSCAGTKRWEDAFSGSTTGWSATSDTGAPPFTVDVTSHASEFSMLSDVILPGKNLGLECKASTHQRSGMYKIHGLYNAVIDPVWPDAKNGESEFIWELAKGFKRAGFSNLLDFCKTAYPAGFGDGPLAETAPSTDFEDYQAKYHATKGSAAARIGMWAEMNGSTMTIPPTYTLAQESGWGIAQSTYSAGYFDSNGRGDEWDAAVAGSGVFATASGQVELFNTSGKLVSALRSHAATHSTDVAGVLTACNYDKTAAKVTADGNDNYAAMPHYEDPYISGAGNPAFPYTFIDYKSRLNREGRSANSAWYAEFKSCDAGDVKNKDVVKINPSDAAAIGVVSGDTVKITSPSSATGITCTAQVWQGVRPGTVAKSYGQGHWAYGRNASTSGGGNNNAILDDQYERLSGSIARNANTNVQITKVV